MQHPDAGGGRIAGDRYLGQGELVDRLDGGDHLSSVGHEGIGAADLIICCGLGRSTRRTFYPTMEIIGKAFAKFCPVLRVAEAGIARLQLLDFQNIRRMSFITI